MIKNKKKYVFIGPVNLAEMPIGGAIVKNQFLYSYLKKNKNIVFLVDTYNWKFNIPVFIKMLYALFFLRNREFVISLNTVSAYKLSYILKVFLIKDIKYFVIGDTVRSKLIDNEFNLSVYKIYKGIYTESRATKEYLINRGLINVYHLPNFKKTNVFNRKLKKFPKLNDKIKFVFLSRIIKEKGVELIIEAVEKINNIKEKNQFSVTFFGPIPKSYTNIFVSKIENIDNISYKGFIDLNRTDSYNILASHHVMIFPTFWHGEGFPGIFIDAFISGLPVIASDWNINNEIITNEKNGLLIRENNIEELIDSMIFFIDNPDKIQEFGINSFLDADKFDVDFLLDKIFIK